MSPKYHRPQKASKVERCSELCEFLACCPNEWLRGRVEEIEKDLKENRALGDKIEQKLWPEYYRRRWGITNLYKRDLDGGWRLTYTLVFDGAGVGVFELEVLTHKEYNRRFGYRRG